jgi:NAD(P)H-hydrate epimerase
MTASAFTTPAGLVVPAVTANEMREIDRIAIEETGPNLFQMMENAGRNLAVHVMSVLGSGWRDRPIVILAGTGGNGGGGVCAGRHLANRGGDVVVVVTAEDGMGEVPAQQLATYRGTSGRVVTPGEVDEIEASLIVDALVGYSLGGPPRGTVGDLVSWADEFEAPVVALDVPSGVHATTGDTPGAKVMATETLTLALPKTGLDVGAVGRLVLADIGIPAETYRRAGLEVPASLFGDRHTVPLEPT